MSTETKYCCDLFRKWIGPTGADEYISSENNGSRYIVTLEAWNDTHEIYFCPFCGTVLE